MKTPYITNVQKYSVHDGEGIRTTIFFKGCPLACAWCHNPETQRYSPQIMHYANKCQLCCTCEKICPERAIKLEESGITTDDQRCSLCAKCCEYCIKDARNIAGKAYAVDELVGIIESDFLFYEYSGGGVTLSGGEVMGQDIAYVKELCKELSKRGYSVYIDTCGHAPFENFMEILPYTDTFLYDIKTMNSEKHKKYTGRDNELILSNVLSLAKAGGKINVRIPVIGGFNCSLNEMKAMAEFIKQHLNPIKINLLPFHKMGMEKAEYAGGHIPENNFYTPEKDELDPILNMFIAYGFEKTYIGG